MTNKKDLIASVAKELGITSKDISVVVDQFIDTVIAELAKGNDVGIGDLGKFIIADTKPTTERKMVSGLTGLEVVIPAKPAGKRATFKISTKIKNIVAGK